MIISGAQIVWESFAREGVQVVFGIPGGAVIPLYHALPDYPIRHILMRHEQAAVHAADGYARSTSTVGACITTSGPGATNLIGGLATAYAASSPIVVITGQAPSTVLGTDAFQEVDIATITMFVTKYNYLVTSIGELAGIIKEAFHIAQTGRPSPVLIAVAVDVQQSKIEYAYPDQIHLPGYDPMRQVGLLGDFDVDESLRSSSERTTGNDALFDVVLEQIHHVTRQESAIVVDPGFETKSQTASQSQMLFTAGNFETPGFALPAAIGVHLGLQPRHVWVVASAETFQATMQELATVVQEDLPLKIIVLNRRLAARTDYEKPAGIGYETRHASHPVPDFAKVAQAYGIQGLMVDKEYNIRRTIAQAAVATGPVLIDVSI